MSDVHPHDNHGHSPAAWTGVFICLVASLIVSYAVGFDKPQLMWIGLVIFALGGIIGWAMGKAAKKKA